MRHAVRPLPIGLPLRVALCAGAVLTIASGAMAVGQAVGSDPGRPDIVDFHEITVAGRLAADGRLAQAYDPAVMASLQRAFGGRDTFLPFGYPPPFALVLAPLSRLPLVTAFLLFDAVTLTAFVAVLRRLAGAWFWPALLATSPAVLIDLKIGQNGLLTAALAGLSVASLLDRRGLGAGFSAGALAAIKPHVAATLPVLMLLRRDGRALVAAVLVSAMLWGLALALFGTASAAAFLGSLGFAGRFLAEGAFPLHRMASVYAAALSLGVPPPVALAIQGIVAVAALCGAIAVARRLDDARATAGLTLASVAFVSPYFYDYDLTIFGAGLALTLPVLAARLTPRGLIALLAGVAGVESLGLLQTALRGVLSGAGPSLMGPALLACFGAILLTLGRTVATVGDATARTHPETCP